MDSTRREFLKRSAVAGILGAAMLRDDALATIQEAVSAAGGRSPDQLAQDEDFWFQIQHAFTVDRTVINLNNGGVSPSPRIVQEALRRHYEYANEAPSRHLWQVQDPQVETVRERLAHTFGCGVDEMAITRNASESLEICIYGIDLKAGDEVVACELDYPRMLNTYRQLPLAIG
ncbi:MAG: aminotransferase class V-fold PLP-dependent enzyme, partial [Planctomycetota bacterium]